jgi:hypothetical protein
MKQNLVIVALILMIVLLVCGYCEKRGQLSYLEKQFSKFELKKQEFKVILTKNKEKLIQQEQLILTMKQAESLNLVNAKNWKNIQSSIKVVTQTRLDTIFIAFNDTLRITDTIYRQGTITYPKHFNLTEKFFFIKGSVLENGIKIDSLILPNTSTIVIGEKKQGLFKKSLPVIEITNTNPYITTNALNNVVIKKEKKIYQKNKFWFSVGTALGIVGTYLLIVTI